MKLTYWQARLQNPLNQAYNENEEATRRWLRFYDEAKKEVEAELFVAYTKINKPEPLISDFYLYNHLQKIEKQIEASILSIGKKEQLYMTAAIKQGLTIGSQTVDSVLHTGALNKRTIDELIKRPWSGDNFSNRIWRNKAQLIASMKSELTSGVVQGKSIYRVANLMDARLQVGRSQTQRLVRTEYMHALNQGQIESYKAKGYSKLRWVAKMDDRTSDICEHRNGKEYDIDNLPDIPAHPNCRCTLVPVISQEAIDNAANELKRSKEALDKLRN
ncbi:minor capsid protein [Enterococcus sp. LJL90]